MTTRSNHDFAAEYLLLDTEISDESPMSAPWRELKDAEIAMLSDRRHGIASSDESWERLRNLFISCTAAPNADAAVCWHGVAALLTEHGGELERALDHRRIEIEKILWLQAEEIRKPTDGYQTQDYNESDLMFRREIMAELEHKLESSG